MDVMNPIPRRKLERALSQKGFQCEEGHNHRKWFFYYQGRRTQIFTIISRGRGYKDYGNELLNKVKIQLRLDSIKQLIDLVNCPMTETDYMNHLRQQGILAPISPLSS